MWTASTCAGFIRCKFSRSEPAVLSKRANTSATSVLSAGSCGAGAACDGCCIGSTSVASSAASSPSPPPPLAAAPGCRSSISFMAKCSSPIILSSISRFSAGAAHFQFTALACSSSLPATDDINWIARADVRRAASVVSAAAISRICSANASGVGTVAAVGDMSTSLAPPSLLSAASISLVSCEVPVDADGMAAGDIDGMAASDVHGMGAGEVDAVM
mmetsp:Transcript_5143/g.11178  ORF Transcript_5143/g.11178 Transcript_5143/m.11178 type:complete len:217 (+) Transcript_5143:1538-2188(+)